MNETKERELSQEQRDFIMSLVHPPSHSSVQTINQNANGAVLLASAFLVGLNLALAAWIVDLKAQIRDLNHHVTAIYMMAPQLKPKETKD